MIKFVGPYYSVNWCITLYKRSLQWQLLVLMLSARCAVFGNCAGWSGRQYRGMTHLYQWRNTTTYICFCWIQWCYSFSKSGIPGMSASASASMSCLSVTFCLYACPFCMLMHVMSVFVYMLIVKPGFHYPSWRPELTARVDGWPVSITRQHGPSTR